MKQLILVPVISILSLATTLTNSVLAQFPELSNRFNEKSILLAVTQETTWNTNASSLRGRLDQDFTFSCPPNGRVGTVWGTNTYTDDSSICSAAVHAGLITARNGGTVTIRIRPGESSYIGTTRNGVQSSNYGSWSGSFIFLK